MDKGLETLSKAGVTSVAFSGGEPTLHPHLAKFIKITDELGMFPACKALKYVIYL